MANFTKLQQELSNAKSKFTAGADVDADLVAITFALNSVIDHLRDIGIPVVNTWPLVDLLGALEGIRTGAECPLLEPRSKVDGRPPRPVAYDHLLATASAAITLLMRDKKMSKKNAAQQVALIFDVKKYPLPKTSHSESENWKALAEWRDKLLRHKKDEKTQELYFKIIDRAHRECSDEGATAVLDILREFGKTA